MPVVVLDVWRLRESEPGPENKIKLQTEKRLESTIIRRAAAEQKEAEKAKARQAAKTGKAGKKTPKVKRAKAVKGGH